MKTYYKPYKIDYSQYIFSYAVYAVKEQQSELTDIYQQGFLPYTGDFSLTEDHFYLCRSLRIDLANFENTSENKRVARKIEPLNINVEITEKQKFDWQATDFVKFCTEYAEERFAGGSMSQERLQYVMSRELLTHIFTFRNQNQVLGYVLVAMTNEIVHYWFAFYDTTYIKEYSLGKYMMWYVIRWAKDNERKYAYLGTCYKEKALYKVRDHKGTEFFDGITWNNNAELLKTLCKNDEHEKY